MLRPDRRGEGGEEWGGPGSNPALTGETAVRPHTETSATVKSFSKESVTGAPTAGAFLRPPGHRGAAPRRGPLAGPSARSRPSSGVPGRVVHVRLRSLRA